MDHGHVCLAMTVLRCAALVAILVRRDRRPWRARQRSSRRARAVVGLVAGGS
jgi:hypothetical protein